jgi:hypothetical protein
MADHVSIARTGKARTFRGWQDSGLSFDAYFQPGDRVDEETYYYFLEILPPRSMREGAFQVGEPNDHRGPNGSARYSTFVCCGGYYYAGYQPAHTTITIA